MENQYSNVYSETTSPNLRSQSSSSSDSDGVLIHNDNDSGSGNGAVEEVELNEVPETNGKTASTVAADVSKQTEEKKELDKQPVKHVSPSDAPSYRWWVMGLCTVAILLASVQGSALIVALPGVMSGLDATFGTIIWVLVAYLIVITGLVPLVGELSDIVGRKRVFNAGFFFFTLGSLLGGLSKAHAGGWDLVGYRILQGFGAAMLFSNSGAILTDAFARHNQVGLAMGVSQVTSAVGSIIGPLLGGAFEKIWRWVFYFNVPISGLAFLVALWKLREEKKPPVQLPVVSENSGKPAAPQPLSVGYRLRHFDWIGAVLFLAGVFLLLTAIVDAAIPSMPQTTMIIFFAVGGACFLANIYMELRIMPNPAIYYQLFLIRQFTVAQLGGWLMAFSRSVVLFACIFYFQGPFHKTPLMAGVLTIPFGAGILVSGFPAGKVADKYGPRLLQVVGPIVACAGCLGLAFITGKSPYAGTAIAQFVVGIGNGLFNSPNSAAMMIAVPPKKRGAASGWMMAVMFFAQTIAIGVLFCIIKAFTPMEQLLQVFLYGGEGNHSDMSGMEKSIRINFWIAFGSAVAALVFNVIMIYVIPGHDPNRRLKYTFSENHPEESELQPTITVP